MNDSGDEASLAFLIGRSAELKRAVVDFACGPRFDGIWHCSCWRPQVPKGN
jgi:hypothetical protein